jgi:hypothetical protein
MVRGLMRGTFGKTPCCLCLFAFPLPISAHGYLMVGIHLFSPPQVIAYLAFQRALPLLLSHVKQTRKEKKSFMA